LIDELEEEQEAEKKFESSSLGWFLVRQVCLPKMFGEK
jgi:hypothetical protein